MMFRHEVSPSLKGVFAVLMSVRAPVVRFLESSVLSREAKRRHELPFSISFCNPTRKRCIPLDDLAYEASNCLELRRIQLGML